MRFSTQFSASFSPFARCLIRKLELLLRAILARAVFILSIFFLFLEKGKTAFCNHQHKCAFFSTLKILRENSDAILWCFESVWVCVRREKSWRIWTKRTFEIHQERKKEKRNKIWVKMCVCVRFVWVCAEVGAQIPFRTRVNKCKTGLVVCWMASRRRNDAGFWERKRENCFEWIWSSMMANVNDDWYSLNKILEIQKRR